MSEPSPITTRAPELQDFDFCQRLYFETMREIIEALHLDTGQQHEGFARQWQVAEVRIIAAAGEDVGWMQTAPAGDAVFLKQLYLDRRFQRRGIVLWALIEETRRAHKAITFGVVKINPARRLYERLGFRITHEDQYKFYMRLGPDWMPL